jgi:hypothetical protein
MVNQIASGQAIYQAQKVSEAYSGSTRVPQTNEKAAYDPAVTVEVSPTGQATSKLLASLPSNFLDPAYQLSKVETELKAVLDKFGISDQEDITITSKGDGTLTVSGDHPLLGEVEKLINSGDTGGRELRNAVIGAHNANVISHIAQASEMFSRGVEENPSKAESYGNRLLGVSSSARNAGFTISVSGGEASALLVGANGNSFAPGDGLTLPT